MRSWMSPDRDRRKAGPQVKADLNAYRFGRWGEVFGDEVVAAAMIDRLVHHAEVVSLRGDSYRLKDRDLGRTSTASNEDQPGGHP
jgi:hypothetical protein